MNIADLSYNLSIGGGSVLNTPKQSVENRGAFWSALSAACAEKPGQSNYLFSSKARRSLSDSEIAGLASKYDPGNMTGEQYEAFLGELEELGAITEEDYETMRAYNLTMTVRGYTDENGGYVTLTREEALQRFGDAGDSLGAFGGSLIRLLDNLTARSRLGAAELSEIAGRVAERRETLETAAEPGGEVHSRTVMEQINDPGGDFWMNLRQSIIENAKEKQEEAEEEEKIELLTMMLDNLTGQINPSVSAAMGLRLGLNADQSVIQAGHMPSELYAYLLTLGTKTSFEVVEDPEEKNDDRIAEVDSTGTEKLHANSEKRHDLTENDLAGLAEQYDPNNMSREEYDRFLEDMVKLGIASEDVIERIGYHGLVKISVDELMVFFESDVPNAPMMNRSPIDNDIEGWIKNRMLWKPGITRESAKRMGLTEQYNRITEEEQTLARIAQVLADVKNQRYRGLISL